MFHLSRGHRRVGLVLVLGLVAFEVQAAEPIVVLVDGYRRDILPTPRGKAELVPIDAIVAGMGVSTQTDAAGGSVSLAFQGREIVLYKNKSLASVAGDLRLLSAPSTHEDGRWLVPVDALPRLLGYLLGKTTEWRPSARALLIGNVQIPKITLSTYVSAESVRVVLEASEKVPFRVIQGEGQVSVAITRDLLDVTFSQERLAGGIVESVRYAGGKENLVSVTLGSRFQQLKAAELEGPPRLVLEFLAAPGAGAAAPRTQREAATPPPPATAPPAVAGPRTVVIDPGHGGGEVGAKGPGGALEKDVTLAIARKLRGMIANQLGFQVFLTRDKDEEMSLDERTAIANNFKADLFISIHANASRSQGARGSEVYFLTYQSTDAEIRRLAQAEGGIAEGPANVEPGSDLALILWDMAQAQYLEESSALASRVQEELAEVTESTGRGVKQAPFRVLVGAGMPAILVEVAFISHPEEEKLLTSEAYQTKVAAAVMRGVARFAERFRADGRRAGS